MTFRLRSALLGAVLLSLGAADAARAVEGCETVRGRMQVTNGTPSVRIWLVGTKRMLGVREQDAQFENLPAEVRKAWASKGPPWEHRLYGDFRVCALTSERPGWMQMVRVESGKNLRVD
jgi:hypothetical protein